MDVYCARSGLLALKVASGVATSWCAVSDHFTIPILVTGWQDKHNTFEYVLGLDSCSCIYIHVASPFVVFLAPILCDRSISQQLMSIAKLYFKLKGILYSDGLINLHVMDRFRHFRLLFLAGFYLLIASFPCLRILRLDYFLHTGGKRELEVFGRHVAAIWAFPFEVHTEFCAPLTKNMLARQLGWSHNKEHANGTLCRYLQVKLFSFLHLSFLG